jgi:GAF domain-containing protein/signal transduction histidine kinase
MTLSTERTGHAQRLVALQSVLEQIRLQQQIEPLLGLALAFIQTVFDYPLVWLATYSPDQRELTGVQGAMPKTEKTAWAQQGFKVLPGDYFDQVLLTGQPAVIANLQKDQRAGQWQTVACRTEVEGALIYPLWHQDQPYGVILLGSHHWGGNPRPEEMTHLSILSGALGAALQNLQPQGQSPGQSYQFLQAAVSQLTLIAGFEERMAVILQSLHQALMPTQTSLYWLDPQQKCFWQRLFYHPDMGKRVRGKKSVPIEVPLADVQHFYQALRTEPVVAVSEIQGAVHTKAPARLMQQMRRRSLLSAPVMFNQQFCGFLAVEGAEPRVWQDQEKQLIQSFAQLASFVSPAVMEDGLPVYTAADDSPELIVQILQSVAQSQDWAQTQQQIMEQVCLHLQAQWMAVLSPDARTGRFQIVHQIHTPKLKPSTEPFQPLSDVDKNMMRRSEQAIAVDNLADDLRLLAWKPKIEALGIKALLLSHTTQDQQLDQILLVGGLTPRTWTASDCYLLDRVCQALQAGRQHHQLQVENQQQHSLNTILQQSLLLQDQAVNPKQLVTDALQGLLEVLSVPAAAVVLWEGGQAEIAACIASLPDFDLIQNTPIDMAQDGLLQSLSALGPPQIKEGTCENIVSLPVQDLTPETRLWLNCRALGQVLAIPILESDQHQPLGAVIFCDRLPPGVGLHAEKPQLIDGAAMLVRHLAGRYRSMVSLKRYSKRLESLNCLSWYQYRQVEYHCQTALTHQQALAQAESSPLLLKSQAAIEKIEQVMQADPEQFHLDDISLPVASLLRQSLARIETLANQRQLWTQVHNLTSNTTATGVNPKLEQVLYELLLAACYRSQAGQRIDIWCRLANPEWLELSITDQGLINPQLIADLSNHNDATSSTLHSPPGKHFRACQTFMKRLGGQLELAQLEDGRVLSRLMLPLKR